MPNNNEQQYQPLTFDAIQDRSGFTGKDHGMVKR